jgi:hypothetical protein
MSGLINEDVLWFDITVGDGEVGEVVKTTKDLVGIDFD